jgi:hypothetical protein
MILKFIFNCQSWSTEHNQGKEKREGKSLLTYTELRSDLFYSSNVVFYYNTASKHALNHFYIDLLDIRLYCIVTVNI